jgi:biotin carboxyl carrier protein
MQRKFKITVDGREYEVEVEEVTDGNTLIPQPGDMHIPQPAAPAPEQPKTLRSEHPGDLCSPLAGVVESILVEIGQRVEKHEQVAVIEAMKMKTNLVAQSTGRISAIEVKVKDAVEAGQVILSIE